MNSETLFGLQGRVLSSTKGEQKNKKAVFAHLLGRDDSTRS